MANKKDKYKNYSKEELIDELETLKKKKYGLIWDKKKSQEILDAFVNWENMPENFTLKQFPVLKEVENKEIETDKNSQANLLIEGDNYHSLAVLNFTHKNKIDVIYIDPPYNTGKKDFIFNDKYVDKEDPWKHSKWLSFMEKRLRLAKNLLNSKGLIFISIDDTEVAQLKLLCDEIFTEDKLMGIIHWRKNRKPHNAAGTISKSAEFILVYANKKKIKLVQEYTIKDSDENGNFSEGPIFKADKKERVYEFPAGILCQTKEINKGINKSARNPKLYIEYLDIPVIRDGILQDNVRIKGRYCVTNERGMLNSEIKKGNIFINKNGVPKLRTYRKNLLGKVANNLWLDKGFNEDASEEIKKIFGVDLASEIFNYPKPVKLIKEIAQSINNKNAIILDFFAGSGTTGHATLELNKEDGGKRKFVLCTNNENNICTDVCYPRIKKVINGYKNSKGEKVAGIGGNLKYFKTDFVGSDSTDKNRRDLVNKSAEMICIKEDIFDLFIDGGLDYKIFKKDKKFLGIVFDLDIIDDFKKEAEKYRGNFVVYCFSYTEATPEKEFKGLKNRYVLKPIPAVILRIYSEIFKK